MGGSVVIPPTKPEIFWHNDDLDDDPYFAEYLFDIIQKKLGQEYTIERVYANGQTAMQCGTPHFDDGDMTFLYYANKEWMPSWQGHLIFMENEMETSQMVSYNQIGQYYSLVTFCTMQMLHLDFLMV